ncbi:MAG TPA: glycoside hydrolase family 27 protein [Terriglobia bacterium]|nr:glycoside hydrolase family 27 protein [Terriglobia bacterium]
MRGASWLVRRTGLLTLFAALALFVPPGSRFSPAPGQAAAFASPQSAYPDSLAPAPPMGWNSYDSYGGAVNEEEIKANAKYLADHLAKYGWKYVVVDYYWYFANPESAEGSSGQDKLKTSMDNYGRLLPAPNRFPSAAGGQGFKPLAAYVHSLGLKFGVHIMRGIPRLAVEHDLPVLGTEARARDIADTSNICDWSTAMYGVDVSKPAGQAYYNSIAALYASWDVDFIKADDMSRGGRRESYHGPEIEALRKAMTNTGRPMVLSLSPGPAPLDQAASLSQWSQMWRVSDDMWDNWKEVLAQFARARSWARYSGPNHWPDADMLPLGHLRLRGFSDPPRMSRLTPDEQTTLMTLWCIFRSPLMMGGDLPSLDPFTASLLENPETLKVDQSSSGGHQVFDQQSRVAWEANAPGGHSKDVALFDTGDSDAEVSATWAQLGVRGKQTVRDLWARRDLGSFQGSFSAQLHHHGAGLYELTAAP